MSFTAIKKLSPESHHSCECGSQHAQFDCQFEGSKRVLISDTTDETGHRTIQYGREATVEHEYMCGRCMTLFVDDQVDKIKESRRLLNMVFEATGESRRLQLSC